MTSVSESSVNLSDLKFDNSWSRILPDLSHVSSSRSSNISDSSSDSSALSNSLSVVLSVLKKDLSSSGNLLLDDNSLGLVSLSELSSQLSDDFLFLSDVSLGSDESLSESSSGSSDLSENSVSGIELSLTVLNSSSVSLFDYDEGVRSLSVNSSSVLRTSHSSSSESSLDDGHSNLSKKLSSLDQISSSSDNSGFSASSDLSDESN